MRDMSSSPSPRGTARRRRPLPRASLMWAWAACGASRFVRVLSERGRASRVQGHPERLGADPLEDLQDLAARVVVVVFEGQDEALGPGLSAEVTEPGCHPGRLCPPRQAQVEGAKARDRKDEAARYAEHVGVQVVGQLEGTTPVPVHQVEGRVREREGQAEAEDELHPVRLQSLLERGRVPPETPGKHEVVEPYAVGPELGRLVDESLGGHAAEKPCVVKAPMVYAYEHG